MKKDSRSDSQFESTVVLEAFDPVTFFEYLEEIVLYCYKENNNLKVF